MTVFVTYQSASSLMCLRGRGGGGGGGVSGHHQNSLNIGPRFFEVQDFQNRIRNVGLSQNSGPKISSTYGL